MANIKNTSTNTLAPKTSNLRPALTISVLLEKPLALAHGDVKEQIKNLLKLPDLDVVSSETGDGAYVVSWAGQSFAVLCVDAPYPEGALEHAVAASISFKDAKLAVDKHKAHVVITPLNTSHSTSDSVVGSVNLMKLAYGFSLLSEPLAFYWQSAEHLLDPNAFGSALSSCFKAMELQAEGDASAPYMLPTTFWVDVRFFQPENTKNIGVVTVGAKHILGYDIEIEPIPYKPSEVAEYVYKIFSYLLSFKDKPQLGVIISFVDGVGFKLIRVNDRICFQKN